MRLILALLTDPVAFAVAAVFGAFLLISLAVFDRVIPPARRS